MTDPPRLSQGVQHRLDLLRERKAALAAARAAFEERRRHGLKARHEAKLAHLARRDAASNEQPKEQPPPAEPQNEAA
jgi:hypothetical protein